MDLPVSTLKSWRAGLRLGRSEMPRGAEMKGYLFASVSAYYTLTEEHFGGFFCSNPRSFSNCNTVGNISLLIVGFFSARYNAVGTN
jgi:hypothetical protein